MIGNFSHVPVWRVITMQRLVLEWTVQQQLDDDDDDVLIPELTSSITQWLLRWSLNGRHFPIAHHVPVLLFKYKQTLEKLILLNHQIPLKINRVLDGDHHRCERHTPRGLHPCWEVLEETLGFVLRIRTIPIKTNNYDCAELNHYCNKWEPISLRLTFLTM